MYHYNPYLVEDYIQTIQEKWDTRLENPGQKKLVILFHGWISNPKRMSYLSEYFIKKGYSVFRMYLSVTLGSISKLLKEIDTQIHTIDFSQFKQVDFVGHSFGGILAKNMLNIHVIPNSHNFVSLGTPWGGTDFGDKISNAITFSDDPSLFGNGIKLLNMALKTKFKNKVRVGLIAGDKPYKDEKPGIEVPPHDGTVTVESAFHLKENVKAKKIVNLNHAELRYKEVTAKLLIKFFNTNRF